MSDRIILDYEFRQIADVLYFNMKDSTDITWKTILKEKDKDNPLKLEGKIAVFVFKDLKVDNASSLREQLDNFVAYLAGKDADEFYFLASPENPSQIFINNILMNLGWDLRDRYREDDAMKKYGIKPKVIKVVPFMEDIEKHCGIKIEAA